MRGWCCDFDNGVALLILILMGGSFWGRRDMGF